jgi:hypothetical protein
MALCGKSLAEWLQIGHGHEKCPAQKHPSMSGSRNLHCGQRLAMTIDKHQSALAAGLMSCRAKHQGWTT